VKGIAVSLCDERNSKQGEYHFVKNTTKKERGSILVLKVLKIA
jgi:hypothetical protein